MRSNVNFFPRIPAVLLLLAGCSPLTGIFSADPTAQFRRDVDTVLEDSIFLPTDAAVMIVSLDNGEVLYERNAQKLMRPASNLKLLTTSAALLTLGKDFVLTTKLYADTIPEGGVLKGNIYLQGHGDPDFTSADLAELLSPLATRGIASIEGNIVGDATYFDTLQWGAGWMWDDEPFGFAAFNSPLSINGNCVDVQVVPGGSAGDTAIVTIDPPTSYVSLQNVARTGTDSSDNTLEISRRYAEHSNTITVKGIIPKSSPPRKELITVLNPEQYFLWLTKEELNRRHVTIGGKLELGSVPPHATLIAQRARTLDSMVVYLNKVSDNLSAENTLKILCAERRGRPGTTQNGISVVKDVLAGFGIDTAKFLMVDGSGVSHYNLVTAELYTQLLRGMYDRKDVFDLFLNSLPNAGVDGSLESRMKGTRAQNNLHAKTGSISGVSSLSGYVRTAEGEMLAFSMLMQNFIGSNEPYRNAQDSIGVLMARLQRGVVKP